MKDFFRRFSALIALVALLVVHGPVNASGVTVTLTPSSSSSSPVSNVAVRWTRSTATSYATGTTITLTITPSVVSVSSTAQTDLDGNGTNDTTFTASSTSAGNTTVTWTVVTSTNSVSAFNVTTTAFTFTASSTNYSFSIFTSNPVDFGSALFYANGGNQVTVSATVPATLSFSIRNNADTADTNTCALGTLSLSSTSTCNYRLRIATNAANGFQAQIHANQDFGTGIATMTNVVNDGAQPIAGTEAYGISLLLGASTGGRNTTTGAFTNSLGEDATAGFTFGVDPSPVPTSSAQNFISYSAPFQTGAAPSVTSTTMVEHAASISAGTPTGNYQQVITYTVTGSF